MELKQRTFAGDQMRRLAPHFGKLFQTNQPLRAATRLAASMRACVEAANAVRMVATSSCGEDLGEPV